MCRGGQSGQNPPQADLVIALRRGSEANEAREEERGRLDSALVQTAAAQAAEQEARGHADVVGRACAHAKAAEAAAQTSLAKVIAALREAEVQSPWS